MSGTVEKGGDLASIYLLDEGQKQVFFGFEIAKDGALGHLGPGGDFGRGGAVESLFFKDFPGGGKDGLAPVGRFLRPSFGHVVTPSFCSLSIS